MPARKKDQAQEAGDKHVQVAEKLEEKAATEGDTQHRQEDDARQRDAEAEVDAAASSEATEEDKLDENEKASKETETEETSLASDALELRDEALEDAQRPFDATGLYAQRAVLDTSGTAGVADQDMRRAYPSFDLDALHNKDVPEHLAKYVVSDEGAPAKLRREKEAREDAPSTKKSKQ